VQGYSAATVRTTLAVLLVLAATTARADQPSTAGVSRVLAQIVEGYSSLPKTVKVPKFAFVSTSVDAAPSDYGALLVPTNAPFGTAKQPIAAVSTDGDAGWGAADIKPIPCQRGALPDDTSGDTSYYEGQRCMWEEKGAFARAALVAIRDGDAWQPVALHLYGSAPGYVGPADYEKLDARIAQGAQEAETLFEKSIADPKAFAKTLSSRKDTLMFGSAGGERFVGSAKIAATLAKWNLSFKPRDGVVADVAGKSVVWIAANLQATSLKKPTAKPTFYRGLFVYEHTGNAWQLVQLSFSDLEAPK
jgi:hypothetical protein